MADWNINITDSGYKHSLSYNEIMNMLDSILNDEEGIYIEKKNVWQVEISPGDWAEICFHVKEEEMLIEVYHAHRL